jgi:hypothetical protein
MDAATANYQASMGNYNAGQQSLADWINMGGAAGGAIGDWWNNRSPSGGGNTYGGDFAGMGGEYW